MSPSIPILVIFCLTCLISWPTTFVLELNFFVGIFRIETDMAAIRRRKDSANNMETNKTPKRQKKLKKNGRCRSYRVIKDDQNLFKTSQN